MVTVVLVPPDGQSEQAVCYHRRVSCLDVM